MTKAVIFDLDGTLFESRHFPIRLILAHPLCIGTLGTERKCRKKLCDRHFDRASDYYDALFLLMGKGSRKKAERCRKWFYETYMPSQVKIIREKFGPRPQLKEFISSLRAKGLKLAVLSDYCFAAEKLAAIGLSEADFDAVWESPEMGGLKPREEVFLNTCKALGTEPGETLMIGDKVSKDGGALKAGLQFVRLINSESQRSKTGEISEMTWEELLQFVGSASK